MTLWTIKKMVFSFIFLYFQQLLQNSKSKTNWCFFFYKPNPWRTKSVSNSFDGWNPFDGIPGQIEQHNVCWCWCFMGHPCIPYHAHHTLYTIYCTPYTVHLTLWTIHCTPYTVCHTLYTYTVHCTAHTLSLTLYTIHCTPHTAQPALNNIHWHRTLYNSLHNKV